MTNPDSHFSGIVSRLSDESLNKVGEQVTTKGARDAVEQEKDKRADRK